ncbi:MAG: hypothetical protein AAGN82_21290, partial [Myxococcota bacterium]
APAGPVVAVPAPAMSTGSSLVPAGAAPAGAMATSAPATVASSPAAGPYPGAKAADAASAWPPPAGAASLDAPLDGTHLMGHAVDGGAADVLSQAGAMSAGDVAGLVSPETPSLLQSPSDGQLLVIPGPEAAGALSSEALSARVVAAQMEGHPATHGVAEVLGEQGFTVYTRAWDDWLGPFVEASAGHA